MLIHNDSINELRERFKLNIYEVKIWTSLLSRGIAAASELADISGVPRSRCYDVLESLEKKGFIIMKIGKPIKYIAVQPEAIVERVKKNLHEDALDQLSTVSKIQDTDMFKELELLHETGVKKFDVDNITDSVLGRLSLNRAIKQMLLRAEKSVAIITTEAGLKQKLKVLKKAHSKLLKKNVPIKLYTNMTGTVSIPLENVDKLYTKMNARAVIVDNAEIMFVMAGKTPDQDTGVWINSPFFVQSVTNMLERSHR